MDFQLPDLNTSEFIRSVRFLATSNGLPRHLADAVRPLRSDEITRLEEAGNVCADWSAVRVAHDFTPTTVVANHFIGTCVLGRFHRRDGIPAGIYHSTIKDSVIGEDCAVYRCPMIEATILDRSVHSIAVRTTGKREDAAPAYANGLELSVGIETGGREIEIFADLDHDLAESVLRRGTGGAPQAYRDIVAEYRRGADLPWTYIGSECTLDSSIVVASWVGAGSSIIDNALVRGSTLLSGEEEPVVVSGGAHVVDSILQWGVSVGSQALVQRSVLLEHSHCERHGKIAESIIAANTSIGEGEVTASFVGPFVAAHHQSLVIALFWPEGRGNIGYGANVGSNHTSRAPDQEAWPGEGMFFGLDCSVKFPANFSRSPYSVIATGVVTAPQRLAFPFSLVTEITDLDDVPAGLNLLIPAWMLRKNVYALMRNEAKFRRRNKARRSEFDFDIFRPAIMTMMEDALHRLVAIEDRGTQDVYLPGDIDGLGANVLRERDRKEAITAYEDYIRLGRYRRAHPGSLTEGERRDYGNLLIALSAGVRSSRERDTARGDSVIPDYRQTHPEIDDDHFVRQTVSSIKRTLATLDVPDLAAKLD